MQSLRVSEAQICSDVAVCANERACVRCVAYLAFAVALNILGFCCATDAKASLTTHGIHATYLQQLIQAIPEAGQVRSSTATFKSQTPR